MNSPKKTGWYSELAEYPETKKEFLRQRITSAFEGVNIKSSLSLGGFFNRLNISKLPHITDLLGADFIDKWNEWVRDHKERCLERTRENATKVGAIIEENLTIFLGLLYSAELIEKSHIISEEYRNRVGLVIKIED